MEIIDKEYSDIIQEEIYTLFLHIDDAIRKYEWLKHIDNDVRSKIDEIYYSAVNLIDNLKIMDGFTNDVEKWKSIDKKHGRNHECEDRTID